MALFEKRSRDDNGAMVRGLAMISAVVLVGLVGCVADPNPDAPSEDRWLAALPAGVTATADSGDSASTYTVRVAEGLDAAFVDEFEWRGTIDLVDLTPREPVAVAVLSTGSLDFTVDSVPMLELDNGYARPIVDRAGLTLGLLSAAVGRYGTVLDVDDDGAADVIEALATGDVTRVVVTSDIGEGFLERARSGDCAGRGAPGWDDELAIVAACSLEPAALGGATESRSPTSTSVGRGPFASTSLRDPVTEPGLSDGDQLIADLERYGADVVLGALLNDAVGDLLPDSASEVLGAVGGIVADGEGEAADYARILTRSTDDLRDAVVEILASLGGDGDSESDADSDPGSLGCEVTTFDGACVDGDDAGSRGEPHQTTHDGLRYDFQVVGEYVLTRTPTEEVHVRYEPYAGSRSVSVLTAIAVRTPDGVVQVRLGDTASTIDASWNDEAQDAGASIDEGGTRVEVDDATVTVVSESGFRLVVRRTADLLNSYLAVDGPSSGLLGDNDGDPSNDLRIGDRVINPDSAEITEAFADAWRLDDAESLLPYRAGESGATFTDRDFPEERLTLEGLGARETALALVLCRESGVLLPGELASCVFDIAVTGDVDLVEGYAAAAPSIDDIESDQVFEVSGAGRDRRFPVVAWAAEVIDASDAVEGDAADALGPQNTRNVRIGEGDASCEHPLDLRFDEEIVDGPGPDLGVAHIGVGSLEYEVWISDGAGPWVFAGALSGRSVLDVSPVLGDGGSADRVRLCDAPAEIDGTGQGAGGPAFDAVAILGIRG